MERNHVGRRLLMFLPSLAGGGAERVMINLANALVEEGVEVRLVCGVSGVYEEDVDARVNLVVLESPRSAACIPGLVRELKSYQPDAFLSAMTHANLVAVLAHRIARVRATLVVSVHNDFRPGYATRRARIVNWLALRAYRLTDTVVAVSSGVADGVIDRMRKGTVSIRTIHNPIPKPFGADAGQSRDPHLVLAAGRFVPQKDYSTLLKAFAIVVKRCPEARLAILGSGPGADDLREKANNLALDKCVEFPGFVEDVGAWMSRAQVFVLSSVNEGLPTVLVEAMHAGAGIVSTDCPSGPREILEDGKWGWLVPVRNPPAMADAIVDCLSSANSRGSRGRAADFSPQVIARQYLEVLFPMSRSV